MKTPQPGLFDAEPAKYAPDDCYGLHKCKCGVEWTGPPSIGGRTCAKCIEREWTALAHVDIKDNERWQWPGKGVVIVRGTSPTLVWFSCEGASQLEQQTRSRKDFLTIGKKLPDLLKP